MEQVLSQFDDAAKRLEGLYHQVLESMEQWRKQHKILIDLSREARFCYIE